MITEEEEGFENVKEGDSSGPLKITLNSVTDVVGISSIRVKKKIKDKEESFLVILILSTIS